jgi:ribosomal protein S14
MTFWASWRQAADVRRRRIFAEYGPDRLRYKAMKTNNVLPRAIIDEFAVCFFKANRDYLYPIKEKMLNMPKAAHPQYCLKMCMFTGRRRGKVNRLRVNRHVFREFADSAKLSGYTRAIW